MPKLIIYYFMLNALSKLSYCEVYNNRPKIQVLNGDLILESAYDKSIYLNTNGPKSKIFYGGINLFNTINVTNGGANIVTNDNILDGKGQINDILTRIQKLESITAAPSHLNLNISYLARKVNNLSNRVRTLQTLLNARKKDECQSHPCENGGTCLNLFNGYYCLCPSNWKGANCDEDINECRNFAGTDLGCQNGATCINRPGSYECICKPGWYGLDCTRTAKNCSGGDFEMCGHGTCLTTTSGEGIKCICNPGWTTDGTSVACLSDVNECISGQGYRCSVNPRVECVNLPGSFRCGECPRGYEGDGFACYDIDECITIPNGGCSTNPMVSCYNTIGSRICGSCPPNYGGDGITCIWTGSCSINNGGCHPSARCIENQAFKQATQCLCPYGMEGDGIGLHGCYIISRGNDSQRCESNPCGNHGHCHPLRQGYTCICYSGYSGAHCTNPNNFCTNNPCLNGGSCRIDERSSRGFRCECTALYSGELCQVHSPQCGGFLDSAEGSIVYPILNTTYRHNSRCAWVIHSASDKVINVTFSKFNLENDSPECRYDFLQIHDGSSSASQLIGRFCGNNFPNGGNIISSHNNLYFWFRSDQSIAKEGFALHWNSILPLCGGNINATTHGHFSSPGSPGKYPPNRDCFWHLTTTLGKKIELHFFQLDIERHVNCSFDYLAIYDGQSTKDPLLNKYCSSIQPAPLQSVGSELLIHFHSDAHGSGKGFQIAFAPIEGIPGCGGFYTTEKGEIVSPSYNGLYLNNLLCEYKIRTRVNTRIQIDFKYFKLERTLTCTYDFVKIYDGPSPDSRLVGKFCGSSYPKTFTSSSNNLFILFKSDHTTASEGFKITYKSVCLHTIAGDSGIIKSPNYPMSYPRATVCEYIILTTPGKIIQLSFQDFDIEDSRYYNCTYDYVEVRDGHFINSTLLGKYCGNSEAIPPTQISTYNYMYIRFHSDISIGGRGFYANYTTIDAECGGIYREDSGFINHPANTSLRYSNNQNCTWYIIAPEGMHIKLIWNRFELENMRSCTSDYVEIAEIYDINDENVLGQYCGAILPPALTISSNRLVIRFVSDISIRGNGFSLSYSFLDEKKYCGGLFLKSHGFIFSPNWPQAYEPNRDCIWTISVPIGRQITLNITDFDLERPLRDKCDLGDYLAIRDGSTENATLIGKYCGFFKSKRVVSTANSLYLHFHSDFYLSGNGFKIEWDGALSGCGGTLTSVHGYISSPNYPQEYNENAECFYLIVTSSGSKIRISFTELDLEKTKDCRDDYVEIFDGRNVHSSSYGKHCTMSPKLNSIETTSNYAFIKFRSDIFVSGKGFLLNYNTICNNNISGSYGVIESPGYPDKYPLNLNCLWTITVPKGNKINITFTHFDLFSSFQPYRLMYHNWSRFPLRPLSFQHGSYERFGNCETDYLQVKETSDKFFSNKQCGNTLPKQVSSKSNSLQIKFVSGSFFPRVGFRLEWINYGCGGHIKKSSGSILLDRTLKADGEIECEWLIETPIDTAVSIVFTELYMTETENCTVDAIEIYNGQSKEFPLLTKICHKGHLHEIVSSSNFLLVILVKRSSLRDVNFKSTFTSTTIKCGGKIKSQSGIIHSNNYPRNYDDNMDCLWYINVPNNHRTELNFIDFDLYSNPLTNYLDDSCEDWIKIYEGSDVLDSNYTWRICPNSNISQVILEKPSIIVQFKTDESGNAKGFKANFSIICGAVIDANKDGIISNDKYLSHTNNNCTWTILSPDLSKKVTLTIHHLSLPKNLNIITNRKCSASYLRVYDGDDVMSPLIDEYCGTKVPPAIVSHGSALTIQLGSYTNTIDGHFSAHYSTLINFCGGELSSEEGTIASPNYPMSYPSAASCEWILGTSPGNRVYITFETFDLYYSDGCNEDYLEVRENNGGGELLAVYCGQEIPTNTTTATKLYLKFHSDMKNSGKGFLLHYGFLHGNDITGLHNGEITSPLYPHLYFGTGDYSWRIIIDGSNTISLNINYLEIHKNEDICNSKLLIYDGYDEEAPLLDELCGLIKQESKLTKTTSNVAYIKLTLDDANDGSVFHLLWAESNKILEEVDTTSKIKCGTNKTELISIRGIFVFNSPNYPNYYDSDLNCVWIFQATSGNHLKLIFNEISIEESPNCFADYISIYSSNNLATWTPLSEKICLSENEKSTFESASYMKVKFNSDSSSSRRGFQARVSSQCGGLLEDSSGVVEISQLNYNFYVVHSKLRCNWTIKLQPGRRIKIKFDYFNITNDNDCTTFVILRNGAGIESPFLGNGKYCGYSHENRSEIISTSNVVFISYVVLNAVTVTKLQNFKLRYEEKSIECGVTSTLDYDHKWEIINSPNYPSVPNPYIECIWVFRGPPGEIIRIDFLDRFDLDPSNQCVSESVEIRDGSSRLSPLKNILCKERPRPSTVKSSGNTMFIKYATQIAEPRDGFRANVSIDVCGGTIISGSGEIKSPGYPHMLVLPAGIVCTWEIMSLPRHVIQLEFTDIDLPDSKIPCGTKVTVEEKVPTNDSIALAQLKLFCNDEMTESLLIETLTDKVIIKLHYGEPSEWAHVSESKGFRLKFKSSRPSCGGMITSSEGYITTPGYPRETSLRFCQWNIIVPNERRRIRLEILDFDESQHVNAFNDVSFNSMIEGSNEQNVSQTVFESSQNRLTFYVWLVPRGKATHRFKARFSSDEPALCGGKLNGIQGELVSPELQKSYFCLWKYTKGSDHLKIPSIYSTIFLTLNVSLSSGNSCHFHDSKLNIKSDTGISGAIFRQSICVNNEIIYRIPTSSLHISAIQYKSKPMTFKLNWKLQPCGGIVNTGREAINVINVPESHNDTINCAWLLTVPKGFRIEFKLEGLFNLDCSDEFIHIKSDIGSTMNIGEFCKNNIPSHSLVSSFMYPFIQYHSKPQNKTGIKLMTKIVSHQCGGYLVKNDRIFSSPNYPGDYEKNQECIWKIQAEVGFRISLKFIDRFVIEDKVNCTKDVLIIYDWNEDKYEEMARLCGRRLPPAFNSTSNRMKVVFRTDADINLDGFKAVWEPKCGGTFIAEYKEQYLYSPGYTKEYYPSLDCNYKIVAPLNRILLKFLDFELEGSYPECRYDNLTITEHSDYRYFNELYCGKVIPPKLQAYENVEINFKTDRFTQRKGFKLSYSLYSCGGQVKEPILIKSQESEKVEETYAENTNCTWFIEAPANKVVIIKFLYIDLESSYDCFSDYVAVYEEHGIDSNKRLSLMCGHINSTTVIKSNSNNITLQFVSDGNLNYRGFEAEIVFSYSLSVGCGGKVDLDSTSKYSLRSPLIGNTVVYENYLDCHWTVRAPTDKVILVSFISFHIAPCANVNQTALGFSNCDCDLVELKDGINPNNLIIGTYCGHTIPAQVFSSTNLLSIRLSTDGEGQSSGFEAILTAEPSPCGESVITVSNKLQRIRSPGYETGSIPRGLHCTYFIDSITDPYSTIHLRIHDLDIEPGSDDHRCNRDRLLITSNSLRQNESLSKEFILNAADDFFSHAYYFDSTLRFPTHIELCGLKKSLDFYVSKSALINIKTIAENTVNHRGVEVEISYIGFCGRNYTELEGRLQSSYETFMDASDKECYTLITVPENYSISVYFMSVSPVYWDDAVYLEIFDGNNTNAPSLMKISNEYPDYLQAFSNGNSLLIHNRLKGSNMVTFDLNYVATNKGKGCGGKLHSEIGRVTSPLYPQVYRKKSTCEWELETPSNTRIFLKFVMFDLGSICDLNYLSLVDRNGNTISTYCSEMPAVYTSDDNYVKIIFATTRNNGGTGWVLDFYGII